MFQLTRSRQDVYLNFFLKINSYFSLLVVLLIFLFIGKESIVALSGHSTSFIFDKSWFPTEGQFNMVPMLVGSLLVTFGSVVLALPFGILSAIFVGFYCPQHIKVFYRRAIELYTGIPSVIFGFWGLMKLVPIINKIQPPGQSLLAGILVLALMIFPIITLSLMSCFEMATTNHFKVSESLGLKKSTYIWFVLLPSLKAQILGASILSIGRAIGETMAVLMVCGNIVKIPSSLFEPVRTLTANIALEMAYAMGTHRSALFLSGLILLVMIGTLLLLSETLKKRFAWKD
ncbi:phosphate ABC transporter permease subunit PstC [Halobacteriovorax sp.]|uniref:phosphate ABC transporter permease subunit PstC n=1 Tax=Halobacteriovorax sp. TaxID=2020862 RepID=UPI003AF2A54F